MLTVESGIKNKVGNMKKKILLTYGFIVIFAAGCGPTSEILAVTMVAQTDEASTLAAPTPTPSPVPQPSATQIAPTPTPPPQPTATAGPFKLQDDFSSRSLIWGDCENCEWKNGALYFGPFPPAGSGPDQVFYILCEACGEVTYYRVAADVAYAEGYAADRTFGILAGLQGDDLLSAGTITTRQHALYETFDFNARRWGGTPFDLFGAVKPGRATNRIEVTLKRTATPGKADVFVNVNGSNVIVLFNQDVRPSKVGLYLGWHSVGIIFDNFEFETDETVP